MTGKYTRHMVGDTVTVGPLVALGWDVPVGVAVSVGCNVPVAVLVGVLVEVARSIGITSNR
jgi:hypothetical protein